MKQQLTRSLTRLRTTFVSFTVGQKVVTIIGSAAVLIAAVMVLRWVAAPTYAPLYNDLAAEDASAIIDELNAEGVPYQLADGGATVMVPRDKVYDTRITLSGQGLPSSSGGEGYSILDDQGISTSEFQEQTDFKRAMEGELSTTIEAIDGVDTAVVHLALPPAKVFATEQDPPTASILIDTATGTPFGADKVQAVIHLVASSVDGLSPDKVTVADAKGQVLSGSDGAGGAGAGTRDQRVADFQDQTRTEIQRTLDKILGPGNSTVQVTADLDFDKSVKETTTYDRDPEQPPLSSTTNTEKYNGPAGSGGGSSTGVVGPDGQMGPTGNRGDGPTSYEKRSKTSDNAVGTVVEHRETAPGSVNSLHVGVFLDTSSMQGRSETDVEDLIAAAIGIDPERGDTLKVTSMAFDRAADEAAAKELAAAAAAEKKARMWAWARNAGIAVAVLAVVLLAWIRGRRRTRARESATTYLVEQLRHDAAERASSAAAPLETPPALAVLEGGEGRTANDEIRQELAALVERQPEDVAALLRGWLVDRR